MQENTMSNYEEIEKEVYQDIRKKANRYFFSKVLFNAALIIIGAVLIAFFLRFVQNKASLYKQRINSELALNEAVETLETNEQEAEDLSAIFHDSNQDMLDDLSELFKSGVFDHLAEADEKTRAGFLNDLMGRTGVEYLFLMDNDGRVVFAPAEGYYGYNLTDLGLLSRGSIERLVQGTKRSNGTVEPVAVKNSYGDYYFYSIPYFYGNAQYTIVLGSDASVLDVQISSLRDLSAVLRNTAINNEGFLFAVDTENNSFSYFENDEESLTGKNVFESGLSEDALVDGYSGIETINGIKYHCVSKSFGNHTVICAVALTENIYANDRHVLFWSISCFVMVMIMCLAYAVIVRNDFVRRAVDTEKKFFVNRNENVIIFDISIFKKVFPLTVAGVFLIYGITFYTQTLLEISESITNSKLALEEITVRYNESNKNREVIQNYYDNRFLAKARLIAYILEEDPQILNTESELYYSYFDENDGKQYVLDNEGNRLKAVANNEILQAICDGNDINSIYVFDEDGHTIATNTDNRFFSISHKPGDQSYEFLDLLTGQKDFYIQDLQTDDLGETSQYIGVVFHYYTTKDAEGNTVYVSSSDYKKGSSPYKITSHKSMLQIGLDKELSSKLMASTDVGKILSSDILGGGFIVLFDNSPEHLCVYSPNEASIGIPAKELGISYKAFSGLDYYGFNFVNGVNYFQYYRYIDDYFIGTAIPTSTMYSTRTNISVVTSLTSFILILILSGTITITTEEEESLYQSMSETDTNNALDSAIFNVILPSGRTASTVKAAARWDNRRIPWSEKNPEQKLMLMLSIVLGLLMLYVIIVIAGVNRYFEEGSIIQYIISGNWDRGMNIFALSACVIVMICTFILISLFRIPARITSSLLGARGETIAHLLLSVVKYGGTIGAIFYCLYLVGMDPGNLLASAGVLSLIIGLGAQSLIKDILAGIFIVFEGEFRVGDIVTINDYRGTVMDIGLRTTKIMNNVGNIKIYNNSEISGVLNMTKEASFAVCIPSIEYGQDINYVEEVLRRELPKTREKNPLVLSDPIFLGVLGLGESGVQLLIICKCNEKDIESVKRYLNRCVLEIFYKYDINVPFPNLTVSSLETNKRKTMADLQPLEKEEEKKDKNEKPKRTVKRNTKKK